MLCIGADGDLVYEGDAVTFATVDTGQGANELYDMDQNVLTTSTPQFARMGLGMAADASNILQMAPGADVYSFLTQPSVDTTYDFGIASGTKTAGNMFHLWQNASTFAGDGLFMNFAVGSGSFTGNFVDFQVNDSSKFSVDKDGHGVMAGDLTIAGDDLKMATNTLGAILVGDGTNFNPVVMGGDASVVANGTVTVADDIVGDGTTGRVLRKILLRIQDGTAATTIKPSTTNVWNGDANSAEDDLGKGGDTGDFALDAAGFILSLQTSGISGDPIVSLAATIVNNAWGLPLDVYVQVNGTSFDISFRDTTGTVQDMTTGVDTGEMYIEITYLTSS